MLPGLRHARNLARSTACINNLHQLGVAMATYHTVWNCFPSHQWKLDSTPGDGHNDKKKRMRWFRQLREALGLGWEVQKCPSAPMWVCGRNNSYGYNYKYLGSSRTYTDDNGNTRYENFPVREVPCGSHTIAFGDSSGTGTDLPYEPIPYDQKSSSLSYDVRKNRLGNHGYTLDPTYISNLTFSKFDPNSADRYADHGSPSFIAPRHDGKANLCMVDGHVESLTPEEVYADNSWWNGYGREFGPNRENRDDHVADKIPGLNERYGW
jgi:prepilin-type processing-associated H-X9-DG protein